MSEKKNNLDEISQWVRYWILKSTTKAGSGHPTSSLSATDLIVGLMFGGTFRFNVNQPKYHNNDRLIFSKGHASPLFYAAWAATGKVKTRELLTLRKFTSKLEGHPTMLFPYTEAATGSLGQGLSVGVGMALNAKYVDKLNYRTYVLLGDSEMAEGSVWEAMQIATHYKLNNLIGIIDVNRLGQRGETMYGHKMNEYKRRVEAFGWRVLEINGHDMDQVVQIFKKATKNYGQPVMIIAKTLKGKGIKYFENKEDWHGKALKPDELKIALKQLGEVNQKIREKIRLPDKKGIKKIKIKSYKYIIDKNKSIATREAYGHSLVRLHKKYPNLIVLDAEVSNSTFAETFKKRYSKKFFEMFIAEQNMVGTALGFSRRDKIPFISTFAAFFTRAYDQIRMSQYSEANIKFVGSHAGVSIGVDGASQMGLEDLSMFRSIQNSVVLYPSDAISTDKLVELSAQKKGIFYIRTTRAATPVIYKKNESFKIGGSKVVKSSKQDIVTVIGAGITLHQALAAYENLKIHNIYIRVVDLYSVKPIDHKMLVKVAKETKAIITVEDHYPEGGIGEAVNSALNNKSTKIINLAVKKMPRSGQPEELLDFEEISKRAIIREVRKFK